MEHLQSSISLPTSPPLSSLDRDLQWAAVNTARFVHFLAGVERCPQSRSPRRRRSRQSGRRRVTVTIHVE